MIAIRKGRLMKVMDTFSSGIVHGNIGSPVITVRVTL